MISFTNQRLYVKGTCQAVLRDPCTGNVVYSSNKFQTANISTSVTMGEVRGGMGNAIATILPSDTALNVEFVAADFSLFAKAAQLGAALSYSAPVMVCDTVTASGATISIPTGADAAVPVAPLGFDEPICYVQEIGVSGTVEETGTAYGIDPTSGAIAGFASTSGKEYKVFYYVNKLEAQVAEISTLVNPGTYHFSAQMPVFANENCNAENQGSRVGWLHVVVPRLKLGANGGVVGDQTTPDTTSISGQAVAFDADVVSATCSDCDAGTLAYYVYVPDSGAGMVAGLAVIGGAVSVAKSSTAQIPVRIVMKNGQLVVPPSYSVGFTYVASGAPSGTSVSSVGVVTSGSTAGDFEVAVTYASDGESFTTPVNVSVVS